jgi:hypothetical protein
MHPSAQADIIAHVRGGQSCAGMGSIGMHFVKLLLRENWRICRAEKRMGTLFCQEWRAVPLILNQARLRQL